MMKNKKKQRVEQAFTSNFGTVNVGDQVVAITTGYNNRVNVYKGTYLGFIETDNGPRVQIEFPHTETIAAFRDGKEWNWSCGSYEMYKKMLEDGELVKVTRTVRKISTLILNRIVPLKD